MMRSTNIDCPHCQLMNRLHIADINRKPHCVRCNMGLLQNKPVEGTLVNLAALTNSKLTVIVKFWAPWCDACRHFEPVFEMLSTQEKEICFVKVDIHAIPHIAEQYNIRTIPTMMLFRQGKLLNTLNDALPKASFEQWLSTALLEK